MSGFISWARCSPSAVPTLCLTVLACLALFPPAASGVDKDWNTGTGNWNVSGNWTPAGVPAVGDDVYAGRLTFGPTILLNVDDTVAGMTLVNGAEFRTNGFAIGIHGDTTLDGTTGLATLRVDQNNGFSFDDYHTDNLTVTGGSSGAEVVMNGGKLAVDEVFVVDADAELSGRGSITFLQGSGTVFDINGTLMPSGGLLSMGGSGVQFDLDGSNGTSLIDVTLPGSDLTVNAPLTDPFNSTMNIGVGNTVTFTQPLTVGDNGTINLGSGIAATAELVGTDISFQLGGVVNANGGIIDADIDLFAASVLNVNGTLILGGNTSDTITYSSAIITGPSVLVQNGNAVVVGNQMMGSATFDWDGAESSSTTISPGITFTINSDKIDTGDPEIDGFDGTVSVNGGTLAVNTTDAWLLEGSINLDGAAGTATVTGAPLTLADTGSINVTGGAGAITANLNSIAGSEINVNSATLDVDRPGSTSWLNWGTLNLHDTGSGPAVLSGDTIGVAAASGVVTVSGHAIMNPALIQAGQLNVNSRLDLHGDSHFEPTATTSLPGADDAIHFYTDATIHPGATFSGEGALIVEEAGDVELVYGAQVDVTFDNSGRVSFDPMVIGSGSAFVDTFIQRSGGSIAFGGDGLDGPGDPNGHDHLNTNSLTLAGELDLDPTTPELIPAGSVFEIISYESRDGTFDSIKDAVFGPGNGFYHPIYDAASTVAPGDLALLMYVPLEGDVNLDGVVDGLDVNVVSANFMTGSAFTSGDANGDGVVDRFDLDLVSVSFGQTWSLGGAGSGAGSFQAVPEPCSPLLVILGSVSVLLARRRHDAGG